MKDQLRIKLSLLPEAPGIYKMLDRNGNIIYIGKSKCLKKRVKSYFANSPTWEKAKKMSSSICDVDYVVTDTHLEAMLLECQLIKTIKPFYNVLMKRDDRYVYLKVEKEAASKPLSIVYQKEENTFGPFRSRNTLQNILDSFHNIYPICKDKRKFIFEYQIFPKVMNETTFLANRKVLLELFMKPNAMAGFLKESERKMKMAASQEKYETASNYRDIIHYFKFLQKGLDTYQDWINKLIFLDLEISQGHKLFFIAYGIIVLKTVVAEVTEENKREFLTAGRKLCCMVPHENREKGDIDFRNIIYSELAWLPPEVMEIIDEEDKEG